MQIHLNLQFPNNRRVPSFNQTVAALGNVPAIFWRALEYGTERNHSYFDLLCEKEVPVSHVREMIVRHQAKRFLSRYNFQVEDDNVTIESEPLQALSLRFGPVAFRILKSKDGLLPGCGDSPMRRNFYNQKRQPYLLANGAVRHTRMNLIVLWNFDTAFNVGSVWLVYPRAAGATPSQVQSHWHQPLPHPATTFTLDQKPNEDEVDRTLENLLRNETELSDREIDDKTGTEDDEK